MSFKKWIILTITLFFISEMSYAGLGSAKKGRRSGCNQGHSGGPGDRSRQFGAQVTCGFKKGASCSSVEIEDNLTRTARALVDLESRPEFANYDGSLFDSVKTIQNKDNDQQVMAYMTMVDLSNSDFYSGLVAFQNDATDTKMIDHFSQRPELKLDRPRAKLVVEALVGLMPSERSEVIIQE